MAKKEAKTKSGKKRGKDPEEAPYSSIATHPQARVAVRKTKGWVGLAAFVITALLSFKAAVPVFQTGERALIAGVVGYLLAWWFSLVIWRHWMLAEQHAAVEEIERRRALAEEAQGAEHV
jgi:hypothetical protein